MHIADLFRNRKMVIPTRADYAKIPRILAGVWPAALPPSLVVDGERYPAALEWLVAAQAAPYVAIDTEFTRDGRFLELIGLGYPGMATALQIRWPLVAEEGRPAVADALRALVGVVQVVYQNAVADVPILEDNCGIRYADYRDIQDTMQAHAVLWSDWPHELAFLASLYSPCNKAKHLAAIDPLKYNLGDVDPLLENVYLKLRPWMQNHPSMNPPDKANFACPGCLGTNLVGRGFQFTAGGTRKQRYQCKACGKWALGSIVKKKTGIELRIR